MYSYVCFFLSFQSKEWIQLKIQEMQPAMTDIGTNLREATELYQQHEKVLEKLQVCLKLNP